MQIERRFWVALLLYGVLAGLIWFTLGEATIQVGSRAVQIRWIPALVVAAMVLKTVLFRQAERIRSGEREKGSLS